MTTSVEKSIDVNVPVHTAYSCWTQFETFPHFMEGVVEVKQLSESTLHWKAKVGGHEKEWDAQITEQVLDRRIAWRSIAGAPNAGVVTFESLEPSRTRIILEMDAEPDGMAEELGDKLGIFGGRVAGDLKKFKEYVEADGAATGGVVR